MGLVLINWGGAENRGRQVSTLSGTLVEHGKIEKLGGPGAAVSALGASATVPLPHHFSDRPQNKGRHSTIDGTASVFLSIKKIKFVSRRRDKPTQPRYDITTAVVMTKTSSRASFPGLRDAEGAGYPHTSEECCKTT